MAELELLDLLKEYNDPKGLVLGDERSYTDRINSLARYVKENCGIRVLLISGPSGSGKTTTANLLCDRIRSLGEQSMVISLDDYYRDGTDPEYPLLANGEKDYESPYALDLKALKETLDNIVLGRPFTVPKFDFKVCRRVSLSTYSDLSDGCVIIEGLHALNSLISGSLPEERALKVFVSVSTNINDNGKRILSGRKIRFLRRLVRDSLYRNADAKRTLSMWENVLRGEDEYLYPFKDLADMRFDTFHHFEIGVLSSYAKPLLHSDDVKESQYVRMVLDALDSIPEIPTSLVPESSLIKEFIPGGIYEKLY